LHQYYFPAGKKTIHFKDIVSIKTNVDLNLSFLDYKGWGMALNNIWWSCDIRRSNPVHTLTCFVIEKRGDSTRKGFSTENPEVALKVLKKFVPDAFQ